MCKNCLYQKESYAKDNMLKSMQKIRTFLKNKQAAAAQDEKYVLNHLIVRYKRAVAELKRWDENNAIN